MGGSYGVAPPGRARRRSRAAVGHRRGPDSLGDGRHDHGVHRRSEPGYGYCLRPAHTLADLARLLPRTDVELGTDADGRITLDCGEVSYRIPTLPADLVQHAEPATATRLATVPAAAFAQAARRAVVSAGRDALLPAFTGVRISTVDGGLRLVATDRYRMTSATVHGETSLAEQDFRTSVPAEVLAAVARHSCHGTVLAIELGRDAASVGFLGAGVDGAMRRTTTAVLDDGFPDSQVDRILAAPLTTRLRTEVAPLAAALRRVAVGAPDRQPVVVQHTGDRLQLSTPPGAALAAVATVRCAQIVDSDTATPVRFGINPGYLAEVLAVIETERVELGLAAGGQGCLVQPVTTEQEPAPYAHQHALGLMRLPPGATDTRS